ncbi:MAG: Hydrogenase expression/formation protein HypE [Methanomicrobiales archaeon 53_19]|jgi:hydrogenase expression/formation protein HypE|uniref:hydrogenase expression/formation protein HypE n=1 Tax=Methanocalculus sp. TaxID=2004547 RepID=UPI000749C868|nr:hydrogenase expression/formation protein HypE [Methanocalculus sp.]KUK71178.1 MAG: Hydrogenase expression/formation protein HypE [Methanocalculus sp. 52_23]KUL04720.1 MAG: Hydrogenase expression/formation protein HypE [Methanomicrobiales archaeon 53_19]HIJ06937.1 hydrogenase expression/formation protein HypE [Methanocalculus sp.]
MKVNLMHGAGGEVMGELLRTLTAFSHNNAGGVGLESLDDGAIIPINGSNIVLTTDSHVVRPLFFPGGDIGRLSVCGTVNDLAVMGARPIALTSAMIIEEGFSVDDLARIVASMDQALGEAGASIVTGDTKVVERGSLDGIIINTAGIGIADQPVRDSTLQEGDLIISSGTLGDHGISILSYREGFEFGETLRSDVAPVWPVVERALAAGDIHAMKDPTRGGFAAAMNEMAQKSGFGILLYEEQVPIRRSIRSAADLLGIDPLQVANEGKVIMGVAAEDAAAILSAIRSHPTGADAAIIGEVISGSRVVMQTGIGGERFIEPPLGDPVPRVC